MSKFDPQRARTKRPIPLWTDAFLRDTMSLPAEAIGSYVLILMAMWSRPTCDLPDNDRQLATIARVSTRHWNNTLGPMIRPFLTATNDTVTQERLKKEADYTEVSITRQSDKKTGKTLVSLNVVESVDYPQTNPTQLPNNLHKKEEAKASLPTSDDVRVAFTEYNSAAGRQGWPVVQSFTAERRKLLASRLKDAGGLMGWSDALAKAEASDFICGRSSRSWTGFSFDGLVSKSKFTRLMEGNYDNRNNNNSSPARLPQGRQNGPDAALANIARLAGLS